MSATPALTWTSVLGFHSKCLIASLTEYERRLPNVISIAYKNDERTDILQSRCQGKRCSHQGDHGRRDSWLCNNHSSQKAIEADTLVIDLFAQPAGGKYQDEQLRDDYDHKPDQLVPEVMDMLFAITNTSREGSRGHGVIVGGGTA
jgi:hypothetical protein